MIVFAPHPDDETLACGGTLMKRLREGSEVTIIIMTDGRNALSHQGILFGPTPEELKEIRRHEVIKATNTLGVANRNIIFWDFEDRSISKNKEAIRSKSIDALNEIQPTEIYFPSERDSHPDHKASCLILKELIKNLTFPASCYQYSLSPRFLHIGSYLMRMQNYYRHDLVLVDISDFLSQKAAAINEYASQVTLISEEQERPIISHPQRFLKKHEVFILNDS